MRKLKCVRPGDSPIEFCDKITAIVDAVRVVQFSNPKGARAAKSQIVQAQKLLRHVKKEVGIKVRSINAACDQRQADITHNFTLGDAAALLLFGAGADRSYKAAKKQDVRYMKSNISSAYSEVKVAVDRALIQLDNMKLQIDNWIASRP